MSLGLLLLACLALGADVGLAISAHEAYQKRLLVQSSRPASGTGLKYQELRREQELMKKFRKWRKADGDTTASSLHEQVRGFCHTVVDGGCSWMEANKLLFEFRVPRQGEKVDMVREWVLPTAVLRRSTPEALSSKCKELSTFPSGLEFIRDYVSKGVPFIVRGGLSEHWGAIGKWDLHYLNRSLAEEKVKLYISLDGDFEKVQTAGEWEKAMGSLVEVMQGPAAAGPDPDERLLIRPAETVFTFAEYVYLSLFYPNKEQSSFYLQKHDLRLWAGFPDIVKDISPFLFGGEAIAPKSDETKDTIGKKKGKNKGNGKNKGKGKNKDKGVEEGVDLEQNGFGFSNFLQLQYFLFWAGMGSTRGPVHFDENENLFAMVKGRKTWTLFHPSESREMYESNAEFRSGHLLFEVDLSDTDLSRPPETEEDAPVGEYFALPVASTERSFQPFSPVNVTHPDYEQHPHFQAAHKVTCELDEGDVLYLPSNWWHEVSSEGDPEDGLSIGINNFFHPYWKKGSDFVHFSRTEHYQHLNQYITFTDQDAAAAARAFPKVDPLELLFSYDEEGLEDVLRDEYWRPQKKRGSKSGRKKNKKKAKAKAKRMSFKREL